MPYISDHAGIGCDLLRRHCASLRLEYSISLLIQVIPLLLSVRNDHRMNVINRDALRRKTLRKLLKRARIIRDRVAIHGTLLNIQPAAVAPDGSLPSRTESPKTPG